MKALQPELFPATVPGNTFRQRITSLRWRWTLFNVVGAILILADRLLERPPQLAALVSTAK